MKKKRGRGGERKRKGRKERRRKKKEKKRRKKKELRAMRVLSFVVTDPHPTFPRFNRFLPLPRILVV